MLMPLEYHFPDNSVTAKRLDKLLATGYFRTGNYLMRTRESMKITKDALNHVK